MGLIISALRSVFWLLDNTYMNLWGCMVVLGAGYLLGVNCTIHH